MKVIFILTPVIFLSSFGKILNSEKLIFEEEKAMRSSFCMYSDGRFFESRMSGCTGQEFAWGYWQKTGDTVNLMYQSSNIFEFDVINSLDTSSRYQIVKIVDCYNQPVRFQDVCFDTTCVNLYNPGIIRIEKGKSISYLAPIFNECINQQSFKIENADTVTYKWRCNRESIESINGGQLYTNTEQKGKKIFLLNKQIKELKN